MQILFSYKQVYRKYGESSKWRMYKVVEKALGLCVIEKSKYLLCFFFA